MSKTPELAIPDIYALLEDRKVGKDVDVETIVAQFSKECGDALRDAIGPPQDKTGLRLSGIGKPARKLWQSFYGIRGEKLSGPTYIRFLYGHITEAMVLALAELAGHEVTEKQKVCTVAGVKGHQDCRLDGLLIDVKSASSYGFKSFKYSQLHEKDTWGYIPQLKAYAHEEGDTKYGWLALDKSTGELALLQYDENLPNQRYAEAIDYDIVEYVEQVKKMLEGPLPSVCYDPVPDGKAGNMKLASGCAFCDFRPTCWPNVRTFAYSTGPKYLTTVVKDPRVPEDTTAPEGF